MIGLRNLVLIGTAGGLLAGCVYAPPPPPPPPRVIYRQAPSPEVMRRPPPPPPALYEQVPAPPVAHPYWVWRPGAWRWNGYRWVWTHGRYVERLY
jgi:hypothetical protein